MRSISYQIKNVTELELPAIKEKLEAISIIDGVSLTNDFDSNTCVVKLHLLSDMPENEETCGLYDEAVTEALRPLACEVQLPGMPAEDAPQEPPVPLKDRKVPFGAAVGAVITSVILAVLITFGVMTLYQQNDMAGIVQSGQGAQDVSDMAELDIIHKMFEAMSPFETDKDILLESVIRAYIQTTGDKYAEYYDAEAYQELLDSQKGEMCGIGVSVINSTLTIDDVEYLGILVSSVYPDSPAEASGIQAGDVIMYIGIGDNRRSVQDLGYTQALNDLKGDEGSLAEFVVYRATDDANAPFEVIELSVKRQKITMQSVTYTVCQTNAKVGILRVTTFDKTTPVQFKEAMTALTEAGCESFVIDLRGNGGGLLTSVEDLLAYFLQEGDVVLTTKDKYGKQETIKVGTVGADGKINSGSGTLTAEDVGRYRNLPFVVLVDEHTASAAELFTANIRDYELAQVVGVTTYGKGTMQTYYDLAQYGYEGALKLTTRHYFPPSGEGYDGIGITPHVVVALSDEAADQNILLLPHEQDNQLQAGVDLLYP